MDCSIYNCPSVWQKYLDRIELLERARNSWARNRGWPDEYRLKEMGRIQEEIDDLMKNIEKMNKRLAV